LKILEFRNWKSEIEKLRKSEIGLQKSEIGLQKSEIEKFREIEKLRN